MHYWEGQAPVTFFFELKTLANIDFQHFLNCFIFYIFYENNVMYFLRMIHINT